MLTYKRAPTESAFRRLVSILIPLCIALIATLPLLACEKCSSSEALATLTTMSGLVQRDTAATQKHWTRPELGASFFMGDAVKTSKNANAELALDDGSVLGLEEDTLIRFLDRKPGTKEQAFNLELGTASLEAAADGTAVRTSFGMARLEGGAKVILTRQSDQLRYEVQLGSARLESVDGKTVLATAGDIFEISLGTAVLEEVATEETPDDPAERKDAPTQERVNLVATISGEGVSVQAQGETDFSSIAPGERTISPGSRVRIQGRSEVTLSRGSDSAALSTGGIYVVGGADLVQTESGTIRVTTKETVRIAVPGGIIETTIGTAIISAQEDGTLVEAESGKVSLQGNSSAQLSAGEKGIVKHNGDLEVEGRGLSRADLDVGVGLGMVIHDPSPPTAVRFLFSGVCERGVIRLKGKANALPGEKLARGSDSAILPIGPGAADYALHCLDEEGEEGGAVKKGRITVLRDAGHRPMPKKAPSTSVELNGLGYTVLYQNQLPAVSMRWSKAPQEGAPFKLNVTSGGRTRSYSSESPSYYFSSGSLGPGRHTAYFSGGGQVSRRTTINIKFDNATPTASLSTPVHTGVAPGGSLTISGTTLPGWVATVDGKTASQDAGGRFSVKTQMPPSGQALQVGLTHRTRGSHVYLRRPAGTP